MSIADDALVLGLTGSFGSGSTTLFDVLREGDGLGFRGFSLSAIVKEENDRRKGAEPATRRVLQDVGNELRETYGPNYLAEQSVLRVEQELGREEARRLVFGSLRNTHETDYLRRRFRKFFLVAVDCAYVEERWIRVTRKQYDAFDLGRTDFERDERRDRDEGTDRGQQVQLCVDDADILLQNNDHLTSTGAKAYLEQTIAEYVQLLEGTGVREPQLDEILMALAYTEAYKSRCLKRRVGAIVAEPDGALVAGGFNENPDPLAPCVEEFEELSSRCYKDQWMKDILDRQRSCSVCQEPMDPAIHGYVCPSATCGADLRNVLFPNKGMEHCTAIHAEVRAITGVRRRDLSSCVLYTTTFPCFDCAKHIVHAGIKQVVYVEPYTTAHAAWFLHKAGVKLIPFQGVKAQGFSRVFGDVRRRMERTFAPALKGGPS